MAQDDDNEMLLRRYLLGRLDEAGQRQLEERLLTDDRFFAELLVAEDEVVDLYVGDALSTEERAGFEQHFLSTPERQQKLSFARTLKRYIADTGITAEPESASTVATPPPAAKQVAPPFLSIRNPAFRFSLVALLALVIIGGSWLMLSRSRGQNQTQPSNTLSVSLTPGLTRGEGEIKKIVVAKDVGTVELQLELRAPDYNSYRARLETDEGRSLSSADDLKPQMIDGRKAVLFHVPASLLPIGDYQVKLAGVNSNGEPEDAGRYYLRIARQ